MDFEKICQERYSVRGFSERTVEKEKIERVIELARLAPTARNGQPYHIFVVNGVDGINRLNKATKCLFGANTVFIVCKDKNRTWHQSVSGEEETLQDIGIVTTTLMYGAWSQGLGSTYVCAFDPNAVASEFNLPENFVAESLLPVGYIADGTEPSPRHFERKAVSEFVTYL